MTSKKPKMFRIEQTSAKEGMCRSHTNNDSVDAKMDEILEKIGGIEERLSGLYISNEGDGAKQAQLNSMEKKVSTQQQKPSNVKLSEDEDKKLSQVCQEIESIHKAIEETKVEISALHHGTRDSGNNNEAQSHLDALVEDTTTATEKILSNTESIEYNAQTLIAALQDNQGLQNLASDILINVTAIFEACGFHDLAGQRITRIIEVLQFTEKRVENMIKIWGGVDNMPTFVGKKEIDELLSGPKTNHTNEHVTQDDIDALFN